MTLGGGGRKKGVRFLWLVGTNSGGGVGGEGVNNLQNLSDVTYGYDL